MELENHEYPTYEELGWWLEIAGALMVAGLIAFLIGLSSGFL